ncbi:PilZ domain-containing protein [Prosthecodimorpha staleyi]|uniref:PilZ domain-containing protein n=1 Tax=Prosthecodimorpha staleyi TaxID=2840188 RepID=A0A947D8W7_9HYPH|nr:PilZ domain-containing protein [Prosthecodimorpha staleyi]MBT9292855.1 PilZ domain-containing protein [Prosthecodimorpha staleyi]
MSAENRKYPRRRVLKSGVVIFNNRHSTMDCTVRNLSEGGALLVFARPPTLPERFSLRFEDGSEFPCRKAWQSAMSIGVAFLNVEAAPPPSAAPPAQAAEPRREPVEVRIGGTVVYATGPDGSAAPPLDAERKAQVMKALADALAQIGAA